MTETYPRQLIWPHEAMILREKINDRGLRNDAGEEYTDEDVDNAIQAAIQEWMYQEGFYTMPDRIGHVWSQLLGDICASLEIDFYDEFEVVE